MKRKGGEMTIGTIIAMAIGVIILVLSIWQISTGFDAFDNIRNPFVGDSNVDAIKSGCEFACASNKVYDYCSKTQSMNFGKDSSEDPNPLKGNCTSFNEAGKINAPCDIC